MRNEVGITRVFNTSCASETEIPGSPLLTGQSLDWLFKAFLGQATVYCSGSPPLFCPDPNPELPPASMDPAHSGSHTLTREVQSVW